MIQRCTNPRNSHYSYYGGRGITVCTRWRTFTHFFEDMGERPEGCTLDRLNCNSSYSPDNCVWSTAKEQRANTRMRRQLKRPKWRKRWGKYTVSLMRKHYSRDTQEEIETLISDYLMEREMHWRLNQ